MRTDDFRPSSNVEDDREQSASRGGMPGGAGGLGIGTVIIIGLISWYFGIDPSVLLNGAQAQLTLKQDEYALPFNYLWGPQGKPISDPAYQGATLQFQGIGLRPLSPVQLNAVWRSGDLYLSSIRRTRSPTTSRTCPACCAG